MKKVKFYIILITSILITNTITYHYSAYQYEAYYSKRINDCLIDNEKLKSQFLIELYKEDVGFISEVVNNSCFVLKKMDINVEFFNNRLRNTLNLIIKEPIESLHKGLVYVDDISEDSLKIIDFKILEIGF